MASIIIHDQSDEFVKTIECGKGKLVEWTTDKKQLLATKEIDRCVVFALTDTEHALLFHFQISNEEECQEAFSGFCKWWLDNEDRFKSARLFLICPTSNIGDAEEEVANGLMEELVQITKLDPKIVNVDNLEKKDLSSVELYGDGIGTLPIVQCNGTRITPAVPSYDNNG